MVVANVKVFGMSINKAGTDGDGKLTLALGVVAIAALSSRKYGAAISGLALLLSSCVALYDTFDTTRRAGTVNEVSNAVDVSVGIGLWIALLGSLVGLFAAMALAREQYGSSRQPSE